jgi:hypothetical protein
MGLWRNFEPGSVFYTICSKKTKVLCIEPSCDNLCGLSSSYEIPLFRKEKDAIKALPFWASDVLDGEDEDIIVKVKISIAPKDTRVRYNIKDGCVWFSFLRNKKYLATNSDMLLKIYDNYREIKYDYDTSDDFYDNKIVKVKLTVL